MFQLITLFAAVVAFFSSLAYLLDQNLDKFYVFKLDHLHDLSKRAVAQHGNSTKDMVSYIVAELNDKYPGYINLEEDWMFNNAGGAMGAMYIIHASITEYIIIFGTAVGTEGHTGRLTSDNYFHILTGTELAFVPGEYEPEVYQPGSVHHLRRGMVKQYKMPECCFALEYSRGWIPPMLFFGYADGLLSTLDMQTLWKTTRITAAEMISHLLRGKL